LLLHQIHRRRPQAVSILRSAGCLGGKRPSTHHPTHGALPVQQLMFGDA
jgi:hypothetical protein